MIKLYGYQLDAIEQLKTGSILCGGVGSGKSRTSLGYYFQKNGGTLSVDGHFFRMRHPKDLYIITTAHKRDKKEWEEEMAPFLLSTNPRYNQAENTVVVDSWNNIGKYADVKGAFFIFDEQRVVGSGSWVKSFLKIAKSNDWILLSATPGDTWMDYVPVFIANGFFRNRTEFITKHVVFNRFAKYPKVDKYINCEDLVRLKKKILVEMDYKKKTKTEVIVRISDYDSDLMELVANKRWNPFEGEPVRDAGGLCYLMRKISNSSRDRLNVIEDIFKKHKRLIVFYNYDYELDILRDLSWRLEVPVYELNGHVHDSSEKLNGDSWIYLVQYNAGAEGWNCVRTDAIAFYSLNYSYKIMAQSAGRIDRLNTPYSTLYYYILRSNSNIDYAIIRALRGKRSFNEKSFSKGYGIA